MLHVKTSTQAWEMLEANFSALSLASEQVDLQRAQGRILSDDLYAGEDVPGFNRSTVDGYAVMSASTFGCSDSLPSILRYAGEIRMGEPASLQIQPDTCAYVPTGGQIPPGADAMVMLEFVENFGDGTRGIYRPSAPGQHIIFQGDDVKKGACVLKAGTPLTPKEIGVLAALGQAQVGVRKTPRVAVLSTGDELVSADQPLAPGQIRDVNGYVLQAALKRLGYPVQFFGILKDEEALLREMVAKACATCDMVLISGGSSVGMKDATARVMEALGEVLFHGISIKPGKPTIAGKVQGTPVFGLPGHPLAAYFIFDLFVRPTLSAMMGTHDVRQTVAALLDTAIPSNHGREECIPMRLYTKGEQPYCSPIPSKSGLIHVLSHADGYLRIPRDCEGLMQDDNVKITLF